MLAANVYISEGRNTRVLDVLQRAAGSVRGAACVWTFRDFPYNRTGFTIASPCSHSLESAVVALVGAALSRLDLTAHTATHPRLGVVDHISCHPLVHARSVASAAEAANAIGSRIGKEFEVPVLMYGAAHAHGRRLAQIRREAGYFKGADAGEWGGAIQSFLASQPEYGPQKVAAKTGIICLGAGPWVVNFNVALKTSDLQQARNIARAVSSRGGGLPSVEAMALPHSDQLIEIACNLLDSSSTSQQTVSTRIRHLAEEAGLVVHDAYSTNQNPEDLVRLANEILINQPSQSAVNSD
mmetsp:Transcript_19759/g.37660  ORF Transcript_19759/g.37660 Transcript_19759/m.37660 type:complete len:297 (-) Transcript_19759:245-1135(-)|eukprot:CAMPEP_0114226172 /NCGR_PEP_ID=MMETSP0058-20121206/1091_1 /TAXON_ID=36894 /ORGANISM="Pyramimonas parkeae, CCMP726" /LENGTH=296 /DNA_ID=CAMNT_0001336881 /DNA_START=85 /DNA_END=975 /DNA_ORIENTATION=-